MTRESIGETTMSNAGPATAPRATSAPVIRTRRPMDHRGRFAIRIQRTAGHRLAARLQPVPGSPSNHGVSHRWVYGALRAAASASRPALRGARVSPPWITDARLTMVL